MTRYFLGIDIGGTKSHALIADEHGQAVGFAKAGAGNYEVVGWNGLAKTLNVIVEDALASAGIEQSALAGVGLGVAGYDWPGEREPHDRAIASLQLEAPYALVNDAMIGLIAGVSEGWGIGVVSGTGSNCWGRDREGREGRVTGCGGWFGEYGGGGDLVNWALQAIGKAWTQRGPETALTDAFVSHVNADSVEDLLEGLYLDRYVLSSDEAPIVFEVAREGDPVAISLVERAGCELGSLAIGVIRQLDFEDLEFEVVQIGSMYYGSPLLAETLLRTIHRVAPGAELVPLTAPPVIGGVLLGMEQAGLDYPRLRPTLIETTNGMYQD
jgi:N-acetylglucosamine kinase-like BadF-type ATPase